MYEALEDDEKANALIEESMYAFVQGGISKLTPNLLAILSLCPCQSIRNQKTAGDPKDEDLKKEHLDQAMRTLTRARPLWLLTV